MHRRSTLDRRHFLASGALAAGALAMATAAPARAEPASVPIQRWLDRPFFDFQLRRLLGEAPMGGANPDEVSAAVQAIGPSPNAEAWVREFAALGHGLADRARELTVIDPLAARSTALRAANYLRAAEFFIPPLGSALDTKIAMYRQVRESFAMATQGSRVERVQVPENTVLDAYYVPPEGVGTQDHPAVVFFGGLDSIGEELYLWAGKELARQGIGVLLVDGPGNGASLRFRDILSRYDYEVATKAAVDYLEQRPGVDPDRIGLIGISLGGYYAARSAAFERRLRATVVWGAIWDESEILSSGSDLESKLFLAQYGAWVFGGGNPATAFLDARRFTMAPAAHLIRNPILIVHGADDALVPVEQAHKLHDAIQAPKALHIVPSGQPGSAHCQADYIPAAWEVMIPWLLDQLTA
ncbi:alpha/beta hydrolase family protein [Nocardia sp. GCM10030253]|uniref:alpha/beta hydrolase family protein n=1 Tax=Nocardia sp. GCM10030253 TaxID=3273404 RepID=UPI00363B5602